MIKEADRAMMEILCGMFVLTAKEDGKDNGCIVNTVLQATSVPNGLIAIVNKKTLTHDMVLSTRRFTASALAEDAPFALFERFGLVSGRKKDKFSDFADVHRAENGLLYLTKHTVAMFSCDVEQTMDLGTHTLFAGPLTEAKMLGEGMPMTYHHYRAHVRPKEQDGPKEEGWRCVVCGYVYKGEKLPADFVCPWCKHGAGDFEKIE